MMNRKWLFTAITYNDFKLKKNIYMKYTAGTGPHYIFQFTFSPCIIGLRLLSLTLLIVCLHFMYT